MANKKLSSMSDDEFMDAWTKAAQDLDDAKKRVQEFAAENNRRADQELEETQISNG